MLLICPFRRLKLYLYKTCRYRTFFIFEDLQTLVKKKFVDWRKAFFVSIFIRPNLTYEQIQRKTLRNHF